MLSRRFIFMFCVAAATIAACAKSAERCATCGMKIDKTSPFRAELAAAGQTRAFDTSRCALTAFRSGGGALVVQEFYSRAPTTAERVRFVVGSDVLGPMGPDLVPVDPAKVAKFEHDHGGARALALGEVDESALAP